MTRQSMSPLTPLLEGRWSDWAGLPPDASLAALEAAHGRASVLDHRARLGEGSPPCTLSTLDEVPVHVWHDGDAVRRVEHDRLNAPASAPTDNTRFAKFDTRAGTQRLLAGEWVDPARGLALTVTPDLRVIAAAGFAPTTLDDYRARLQPRRHEPVPMPRPTARGTAT